MGGIPGRSFHTIFQGRISSIRSLFSREIARLVYALGNNTIPIRTTEYNIMQGFCVRPRRPLSSCSSVDYSNGLREA